MSIFAAKVLMGLYQRYLDFSDFLSSSIVKSMTLYTYMYDGERFNLRESHGIKAGDMKKIQFVIDDNADIIVARWNEHFNR